jgi:hypothetical protein
MLVIAQLLLFCTLSQDVVRCAMRGHSMMACANHTVQSSIFAQNAAHDEEVRASTFPWSLGDRAASIHAVTVMGAQPICWTSKVAAWLVNRLCEPTSSMTVAEASYVAGQRLAPPLTRTFVFIFDVPHRSSFQVSRHAHIEREKGKRLSLL